MKLGVQFDQNGDFVGDFLNGMNLPTGHKIYTGVVPEGLYRPKFVSGEVVEGMSQTEIDAIKNAPIPKSINERVIDAESQVNVLDDRTLGMQDIDDYTLGMTVTLEDRTQGMKDIDDYTLSLVFELQAKIDQLQAEVNTLKGGA